MFVINATVLLTLVICVFQPFFFFITITRALSKLFVFLKIHTWPCLYFMLASYFTGLCYYYHLLTSTFFDFTLCCSTLREKWSQISSFAFWPVNSLLSYLRFNTFKQMFSSVESLWLFQSSEKTLININYLILYYQK